MKQKVLLFARARDLAGADQIEIEIADGARIGEVRSELLNRFSGLRSLAGSLLIAMNNCYASDETIVETGAEIACFPPVSGG
jgi:molybdopterin converting factor subunit 1